MPYPLRLPHPLRNTIFKALLIALLCIALLAGSAININKAALMLGCLAISIAIISIQDLRTKQPTQSNQSKNKSNHKGSWATLHSYRWHPCWAWLVWAIYIGIRILQTPNHDYQLTHGYALGIGTTAFILGFMIMHYRETKPWLMSAWFWSLAVIVIVQIVFCVIQLTVDHTFILHLPNFKALESTYVKGTYFFEGGFGLFASLITAFLSAYLFSHFQKLKLGHKIIIILGVGSLLFFTFNSNSLTGMIVAVLCVTIFPLFYYLSFVSIFKRSRQWRWLQISSLSIIMVVTLAGSIWNQQLPIHERMDLKFLDSYMARLQYADIALALIQEKPWLGHGARMYNHLYLGAYDGDSSIWNNLDVERVHQEIIQLTCDYGIVGLGLFLIALIWSVVYFLRLAKVIIKANQKKVYIYWLKQGWPFIILTLAVFVTTIGDFSLHYYNNCFLLGLSLGAINAWLKIPKNMDNSL